MTNHPEAALRALTHQVNNTELLTLSVIAHLHGSETEFGGARHELREYFGRLRDELAAILRQPEAAVLAKEQKNDRARSKRPI